MKGKLLFVAGAAVGYVLGARAGRKRYEQIRGAAERIWETPGVQSQVEQAKDFAAQRVGDIPGALGDGAKKAFTSLVSSRKGAPAATSTRTSTSSASESQSSAAAKPAAKKAGASTAKKAGGSAAKSSSSTSKSASGTSSRSTGAKSKPAAESE